MRYTFLYTMCIPYTVYILYLLYVYPIHPIYTPYTPHRPHRPHRPHIHPIDPIDPISPYRLGRSDGDGAWCPAGPVFPREGEYLEVSLSRLHLVTLVATQGRHAGGRGREFTASYRLRYSRTGGVQWGQWCPWDPHGSGTPRGWCSRTWPPPPVARALRIYPRAPRAMSVCLRLELYGCPWEGGLLSYTAPHGQVMVLDPAPVVLNDSTYDGLQFGGLGQLSDGILGLDDFTRSRERRLWPGYDYVGWRRPPGPQAHVELEFEFEALRSFRAMQVHCNNMHTHGVSIFKEVECLFKKTLATAWEPTPATHSVVGTMMDPRARSIMVPLGGRQARFIRCHFFFSGEWMLFSEVTFFSGGWWGPWVAPMDPNRGHPMAKADQSHTSILIGCLVAIILLLLGVIFLILWRQYWKKILGKARPSEDELRVQLSVPGDTIVINNVTAARGPPRYERIPPGNGEYQEPTRVMGTPVPAGRAPPLSPPTAPEGGAEAYAEADVIGGSAHPSSGPAPCPALPSFPRQRLRFRQKLGEGQFGEVLLCEVEDPQALPPGSRPPELALGRPLLVAVKVLRPDATKNARRDFLQEARTMGRLRDPNIVRLLGVCGGPGPLCIITEYMEHGDLHQFLGGPAGSALSLPTLLHVGAQIASGMRFLSRLNVVHRDLATRNCLVGAGVTVKVSDFGMSRPLYSQQYYRVRGRVLMPIRWMAWECILMGTFTPASDAWAFGVTLWEVLTRCREQPYGALSDEQVIANAGHHFRAQGRQEYLPCPPGCPPALHGVMLRCWARDAADRPSFGLLHRLLREQAGMA
uniref:Uncharacterized protein n=1 Tax=Melopsittacus undulatus TaxID=13146 RepID=A0A8V5GZ64_MELUD